MAYLKLDLKTNNPKKLYREIFDVCEDQMSSRGYIIDRNDSPKPYMKENALYNIADFEGRIAIMREIFSLNLVSLIIGLSAVTLGLVLLFYPNLYTPVPRELLGIIAIIGGIIAIFVKSKSSLSVDILIEGEAYRTKSITTSDGEAQKSNSFEQLEVESDVRLTVYGWLREEKSLTGNPTENMKRDLTMLSEKISEVVEPYVVTDKKN